MWAMVCFASVCFALRANMRRSSLEERIPSLSEADGETWYWLPTSAGGWILVLRDGKVLEPLCKLWRYCCNHCASLDMVQVAYKPQLSSPSVTSDSNTLVQIVYSPIWFLRSRPLK
ncbi:hypothetical protein ASPACDRAFT_79054 [Aspergillus aculeatus ATCC 16872]|uniref:Secreted protein n=1 Tax=Aspergillus aculeatus (strain ATCC 16872 / CBS 172.66 / WB 5094) TaxID=690307 RepID=A0A1L9WSG5_ASPA1|nr:uncharacterized protein ASPACDRAFT_79054 [Aspergillus aculeatus ATCC 16872]OJJ99115.1 hypothetical protein ASPACDRAFT_79054 [Aspergillus aculeatus ATCC 16872]